MNSLSEPAMTLRVDASNPGQFFACCGLLELADRAWQGAEGWFAEPGRFCISPLVAGDHTNAHSLLKTLRTCPLKNTLSNDELARIEELEAIPQKRRTPKLEAEKKIFDSKRREEPLFLGVPFNLLLDWFRDSRAKGDRFKTWAGQQSVMEIARAMKRPLDDGYWNDVPPESWLTVSAPSGVPFNFDSDLGTQSSALDVGFSLDPLKISARPRPFLELAAFVGLQRFRPAQVDRNRFQYALWSVPLLPSAAAVAAAGLIPESSIATFEFALLYRTKYLKSFLPATPGLR